jgi:hypothetical protein
MGDGVAEDIVQADVRFWAARYWQALLYRNNNGAFKDERGRWVRFGLGNDSKKMNQHAKSSDLIGMTPILIQEHHLGRILGVFTAIECKKEGWNPNNMDDRAKAQARYHEIVRNKGAIAGFASSVEDMNKIIGVHT